MWELHTIDTRKPKRGALCTLPTVRQGKTAAPAR